MLLYSVRYANRLLFMMDNVVSAKTNSCLTNIAVWWKVVHSVIKFENKNINYFWRCIRKLQFWMIFIGGVTIAVFRKQ